MRELGKPVPFEHVKDDFPAQEGELHLYYGQIGSGKTYGATADIHDDVRRGELVYATWPVKFSHFDDRESLFLIILNTLLFRKRFYRIDSPKNFHFIDVEKGEVDGVPTFKPDDNASYIEYMNTLNHCIIYIDEAWRVIDSYMPTRDFGVPVRSLILVTRHKYRTIKLITQRPTAVQVTARANVNRFFKFVKLAKWPWIRFARYEFQEMTGETVNEEAEPISVKTYWGSKKIFESYNSYFYGDLRPIHPLHFEAFDLSIFDKIRAFFRLFTKSSKKKVVSSEIPADSTIEPPF